MIDRSTKIYMAYKLAQKKFAKENPLLANLNATLYVARQFKVPFLTVQGTVKTYRKRK